MATFIQGVTDTFEQELYTPDFGFLSTAMGQRQARYDKGFNAFKNLASSALNTVLTNGENQKTREDIFKKIQSNLKSTAGLDLSNQSNVAQAMSILDPIVNDKEILYDMSITKQNQDAASKLDSVKNSFDSEIRDMYNEYSEMDIQQQSQKLKSAKRGDGSIMQVQPGEFVPYENPATMLNAAAKEIGLDVEITQAMGDGYMKTFKNGKIAVDPFTNWAISTMGKKYDRYFNQAGKVQTESGINNLMSKNKISKTEATQLMATDMTKSLINDATVRNQQSNEKVKDYDLKLEIFHQIANKNNGRIVNKPAYDKLVAERNNYVNELAKSKTDMTNLSTNGVEYVISNMANIISDKFKSSAASTWASNQAGVTAKIEMKADEVLIDKWKMAQSESQFSRTMAFNREKFQFDMYDKEANRKLKISELEASGKLPTTEYIGQVGGADLPAILSLQASKDRVTTDLLDNTFGAGGVMDMIYSNPNTFNKMTNTINKLRSISNNQSQTLTDDDTKNLKSMFVTFGIKDYDFNPKDPSSARGLLKNIAASMIGKASSEMIDNQIKAGSIPNSDAFQSIQSNIRTLLETDKTIDDSYNTIADIVSPGNTGKINSTFEGVKIVGWTSQNKPIYDFTNASEDAKNFASSVISKQFQTGSVTSTQYNFGKLSNAELVNVLRSKSNGQDFTNVSDEMVKKLFANEALVTFNPVDKTVNFTLKPYTTLPEAKKLGISGPVTFTMTYDEASTIPSERLRTGLIANTMNTKALGIAVDLYKNPNGHISSPLYMEKFGYKYDIQRTKNNKGMQGLNVTISTKNHTTGKWNDANSQFIPMAEDDKTGYLNLENDFSNNFSKYISTIKNNQKSVLNDVNTPTINAN
jgi:hypothetical protein